MPKMHVTSESGEESPALLSGWQATGPSLAVASSAVFGGLGTLLGALILSPVIHALIRLRSVAPDGATIADLVATTLGRRVGAFTATLQTIGYAVLAALVAQRIGLQLKLTVDVFGGSSTMSEAWLWAMYAVAALVLIAVLAFALPGHIVAGLAAVLAAVGLLVYFYLALAVIARMFTGAAPVVVSEENLPSGFAMCSALAVLAVGLVGFEVITTRSREVRSLGRPMVLAVGAATVVAVLVWYADHVGGAGDLRLSGSQFGYVVVQMYPEVGGPSIAVGTMCLAVAIVLALMWAIVRLVEGLDTRVGSEAALALLLGLMAVLIVARCRDWLGIYQITNFVGELLLVVTYAVVVEASARIPDNSVLVWWSRILVPSALAAVVLLPVVNARFAAVAVWPLVIVGVLVGIAVAASASSGRQPAD